MKNSKTTIRELTAKYRTILKKCAFLNAMCLIAAVGVASTANADIGIQLIEDYPYPSGAKTEKINTYTATEDALLPSSSDHPITNIGTAEVTGTVTNTGDYTFSSSEQLNVIAGSSLTITGTLINRGNPYEIGDVGLAYTGPRYAPLYDKNGNIVLDPADADKRDIYAYSINNFGTITADEIRNYSTFINYPDDDTTDTTPKGIIHADVYNILEVNTDGEPVNVAYFRNSGTIIGTGVTEVSGNYVIPQKSSNPTDPLPANYYAVVNSAQFLNGGIIYGNVSNTGTLTSSLDNIHGEIDNGNGILNAWGKLDRDLNGTVNFQYPTVLELTDEEITDGKTIKLSAVATNASQFDLIKGTMEVDNTYSVFFNLGTMTIGSEGTVNSNIDNKGTIVNDGQINGDVTNAENATLTSAVSNINGKIKNNGTLNTWDELGNSADYSSGVTTTYGGTVNIVDSATVFSTSNVQFQNLNLYDILAIHGRKLNVTNLLTVNPGSLLRISSGEIEGTDANSSTSTPTTPTGHVVNNGTVQNVYSQFGIDIENNGEFNNLGSSTITSGTFINNGTLHTNDISDISSSTTLTNNGILNTKGALDRDIGGTVNLTGSSSLATDVIMNTVNSSRDFNIAKTLAVSDNLTISSGDNSVVTIESTGTVNGNIINNGLVDNSGAVVNSTLTNNGTFNNHNSVSANATNNGVFNNNASATLNGSFTHMNSTADSFVNNGTVNAAFTNYGNAKNNASMAGVVANNGFLYNQTGAEISGDITNNGNIQNLATISGDLTNYGVVNNQATAVGTGIIDSEVVNSGILINSENARIINTVSSGTNPSVSNANTLMNYGFIQTKNFTNAGVVHNLGILGDNIDVDNPTVIANDSSTVNNSGVIYNNRTIKANSVTNSSVIENYDLIATKTLTNNSTASLRNQGSIGDPDKSYVVSVNNYGNLYNGGVIYGNVTNASGAILTSPIVSISGVLANSGVLNTWGDLENAYTSSLGGTTNFIYDSSLKQNMTMNTVHVGDSSDLTKAVTLDLGTNKLTTSSFTLGQNSIVKLNVTSKDTYGSVQASSYSSTPSGTKLSFVLDRGILSEGNSINLPVFTFSSGNPANINFGTVENNRYTVTKEDNGTYTISYAPSSSGQIIAFGGDQNVIRATTAWLDEEDMPANTVAAKVQNDLNTLNQTDMGAYVKAVRSLMPETAPVAYTLANTINNKIAEAVEGRFLSRKVVVKSASEAKKPRGRNGGDTIVNRTTGSVWAKGLYNKTKLDTKLGFDAKTDGVAFGIDGKANNNLTIGVGYAYTGSDVDSKSREMDVTTHTGILYAEYAMGQCFMNGVVDYNRSEYDESKTVAGTKANAKHTSDTAFARVMGGFHIPVDFVIFTPEGGLRYLWIKMNGYTDDIGQVVSDESSSSLTGVIGLRVGAKTKLIGLDQVLFWPEVSIRGTYDIVEADSTTSVNLPNGSTYTVRGETLERLGGEATARLGMLSGNVEVSLEYAGKFRKDYYDHTGLISLKYRF